MTKSAIKRFQVQPACENNIINDQIFNISPKQCKDGKSYVPDERVKEKKKSFNNIFEKLKYNGTFYENGPNRGMDIRLCAATHLGISGVKHVLLPFNSLTRRYCLILIL